MLLFPSENVRIWEDLWDSAVKESSNGIDRNGGRGEDENVKRWDRRAAGFASRSDDIAALERKKATLDMLKIKGALKKGVKVLDIGAGPGNWAVPMAEAGAGVVALEPSGEMIRELKRKADEKGVGGSIEVDQRTWQNVNVADDGFEGAFDLVFASMTPGISGPGTLKAAIRASRGFCFLKSFSGGGWRTTYRDIWRELFGEDLPTRAGDFIYPLNYVYALGYRPHVEFDMWEQERAEPIEEALDSILFFADGNCEITLDMKERLMEYILQHSKDGMFISHHRICQGMMLWKVA